MGDYSGFPGWAQCNHKGPYKWKREAGESESGKERSEAEVRVMASKMKGGHGKECGQPPED